MNMRNETEEKVWTSIDVLVQELADVIKIGAEVVPVIDMAQYIDAVLKTAYRHAGRDR